MYQRIAAVAVFLLAAGTVVVADDEFKPEEGFTSLFNGKDLTGWKIKGSKEDLTGKTQTTDERIAVEMGIIVMRPKDRAGKGGIRELQTVTTFPKAFHLKVEFRAALKADSGVYVRGPQLQVRDFIRLGQQKHLAKTFKNDDWNTLDIIVRNDVVSTIVNDRALTEKDQFEMTVKGGKIVAATLNGKTVEPKRVEVRKGAVAECRCNGELFETMTTIPNNGAIGLQAETGKFEFRRVRVKELKGPGDK